MRILKLQIFKLKKYGKKVLQVYVFEELQKMNVYDTIETSDKMLMK